MVLLRVILDSMLESAPRGIARYTEELTRALLATAPANCEVEGIVSACTAEEYRLVTEALPGLAALVKTALPRRELYSAWQRGVGMSAIRGMVHSPTLLAPLRRHDRALQPGEQTVVTIHDAEPWLSPDADSPRAAALRQLAKRAEKYADAVVVPSHAVAADLERFVNLGERVRVIGLALPDSFAVPADAAAVAERLRLPASYLVALTGPELRQGAAELLAASTLPAFPDLPLLVVGPNGDGPRTLHALAVSAGATADRVRLLGELTDEELAVTLAQAAACVLPSRHEGFGLAAVAAFTLGTPVICSDTAALREVADGAGVLVALDPADSYPERLADTIAATLADPALLERLAVIGRDRARAFTWRDSAEQVWQLHADL